MMELKRLILSVTLALTAVSAVKAEEPQLVVNIIVGSMRSTDLDRYSEGFGDGGFHRLMRTGTRFTECYADYLPTSTEAGMATLSTGALPSTHGVVSPAWYDRNSKEEVRLCDKPLPENGFMQAAAGIETTYTNAHIAVQTLSEAVTGYSANSRVVTVALDARSAILTAGKDGGECYWLDSAGNWTTAECYAPELPNWVASYNEDGLNRQFVGGKWYGKYTKNRYRNTMVTDITLYETDSRKKSTRSNEEPDMTEAMRTTPAGNVAIMEFAKRVVATMLPRKVGEGCRMLNICLDTPRYIAEKYSPDSAEYEDMLYCLDGTLAEFLTFLYAQVENPSQIIVTLASPHGSSPAPRGDDGDAGTFNSRQFEVIVNAFLSARYGQDSWVAGYRGNALYLNHDVIYRQHKTVAEIEEEVAKFALQFRGVAYAVTASSLQNHFFGSGVARLMQNGFYPRRSGDVVIALTQGRITARDKVVSSSGSQYNYDRHVPLIICGGDVAAGRTVDKRISTESAAPTIASLAGVARPMASDAPTIEGIK